MTRISLVTPCFNEEDAIPVFLARVVPIMEATGLDFEMLFVDDGSRDKTVAVLAEFSNQYKQIRVVELSRNFGKEAAMTAGLTYASGDAIIPMDCDLLGLGHLRLVPRFDPSGGKDRNDQGTVTLQISG